MTKLEAQLKANGLHGDHLIERIAERTMDRLDRDYLSGALPKLAYDREVQKLKLACDDATYTDGVMRWKSNGRVPPVEYVKFAHDIGLPVNIDRCDAGREVEVRAAIDAYTKARANMSDEERAEEAYEARAAHGPGVVLVDILTGRKFTT